MSINIREYTPADCSQLVELFAHTLETEKQYISHGEIQMGLSCDGQTLAPDFKTKWTQYLQRQHSNPQSVIYVYEDNNQLAGFIICGIENDHARNYGVIYDIVVDPQHKGTGASDKLYQAAISNFKSNGISDCYIESGVDNQRAHSFFERRGFKHISNIYRLSDIDT